MRALYVEPLLEPNSGPHLSTCVYAWPLSQRCRCQAANVLHHRRQQHRQPGTAITGLAEAELEANIAHEVIGVPHKR